MLELDTTFLLSLLSVYLILQRIQPLSRRRTKIGDEGKGKDPGLLRRETSGQSICGPYSGQDGPWCTDDKQGKIIRVGPLKITPVKGPEDKGVNRGNSDSNGFRKCRLPGMSRVLGKFPPCLESPLLIRLLYVWRPPGDLDSPSFCVPVFGVQTPSTSLTRARRGVGWRGQEGDGVGMEGEGWALPEPRTTVPGVRPTTGPVDSPTSS